MRRRRPWPRATSPARSRRSRKRKTPSPRPSSRAEELKAIAEAKKILVETSAGAVEQTYSFLQVATATASRLQTRADLANAEVVNLVKHLAEKHHSAALAEL